MKTRASATPRSVAKSTASLVLGLCSIPAGWTLILPLLAVIFGIDGYCGKAVGRVRAAWGIVLGLLSLAGWMVAITVVLTLANETVARRI